MGGGGGGTSGTSGTVIDSSAVLSGKVYFGKSSLYGGIPVLAKDISGVVMGSTVTDAYGNYSFSELAPGVYNLFASTGESENQFVSAIQVIPGNPSKTQEKNLIELDSVSIDNVTSTSVRLKFSTSQSCISQVEYSYAGGATNLVSVNTTFADTHSTTITGLLPSTRYGFIVKLQTQDGQQFLYSSLSTQTLAGIGPNKTGISIENGAVSTRFTAVRLYLNAENASQMRIGTTEDLTDSIWETYSSFKDVTLSAGDGTKRVYVQFRDAFGNQSSVMNDSILLKSSSNGYIGVWINNGEALTNDNNVVLSMLFPGATRMQLSSRSDFFNSYWEIFSETKKFKFEAGDGPKVVYAKFSGGNADPNKVYTGSIQLDTTGPEVAFTINGGAAKTNNITVTLNFTPLQVPSKMQIEQDGSFDAESTWVQYSDSYQYVLSNTEGTKTVYARFADELGNIFGPVTDQIELDLTPPQNISFSINDGESQTSELEVRLSVSADDASQIMISNNENFAGATYERYKTIKSWVLGGYGIQSVYMMFVDDASNTSSAIVQSIEVIGEPAASGSIKINEDDSYSESATNSLYVYSDVATKFRISENENFSTLSDITYTPNYTGNVMKIDNFVFDPLAGHKKVYVRFQDASGSYSIASDTIIFIGPASNSITTVDPQPLGTYTVNLRPFAEKASEMLITENYADLSNQSIWQPFNYSVNFSLTQVNGKHTIYAKYRNVGHVETPVMTLDVQVSEIAPASPSIVLNAGDSVTNRSNVQVNVVTSEFYPILRLSNDGNFFSGADQAAVNQPWFLTPVAGEKTVYARFQHSTTGAYVFATDTITAVGPASPTISTSDSQPLNKNWVALKLYAGNATDMIVSENPGIKDATTGWVPYQEQLSFPLSTGVGNHTIYAKFRNAATNWIETEPVSLVVSVNNQSPTGNTATFRASADPTSTALSEVPVGSLPAFLHFDIQDPLTATVSWQLASGGAPIPTVFRTTSVPVGPILLSAGDFPGNGTFNLYYYFTDGVGNQSSMGISSIKILGPSLKISPAVVGPLTSGRTQQFAATLENAEGTVVWSIDPALPATTFGSIDNAGLYTAPNPISVATQTIVKAALFGDPNVNDSVSISLQTQVEVVVAEKNHQISLNLSKQIPVIFRNSTLGGNMVVGTAGGGVATISAPVPGVPATDRIATITYTAPASVPTTNPVAVTVSSAEDPTKQEILYFTINSGPWISVSPTDAVARIRTGKTSFAATTSSSTVSVVWRLTKGGFFDAAKTLTTQTTNAPHSVTVYAPDSFPGENPVQLVASFAEAGFDYYATAAISLSSPVTLTLTPKNETIDLGNSSGVLMQAKVDNATTTSVTWQYRNASSTGAWTNIDSPANTTGTLVSTGNDATYLPPSVFPPGLANQLNIRAISIDDPVASGVATITLIAPIEVVIHEGFNASAPAITTTTVLLEVGTRQFFAEIKNATAGTNLTASWYVGGVAGGDSTKGTVDTTGKYSAPDATSQSVVTLRAVSNANTSKFADVQINLQDFWIPRAQNLNSVTNATYSIFCLEIDSTTPAADPRILYCGTNGYGVYRATVSPASDWSSIPWTGVTGLSTNLVSQGAKYIVNGLTISKQNPDRVVAATNDGLYLITSNGTVVNAITPPFPRTAPHSVAATITTYSGDFTKVFSSAIIDPTDDTYMYAIGKDQGVLRFVWGGANYTYSGTLYDDNQFYSTVEYYEDPWKVDTDLNPAPASVSFALGTVSRPKKVSPALASGTMEFNCAAMTPQNPNVLYVGFTKYLESRNPDVFKVGYLKLSNIRTANYLYVGEKDFLVGGTSLPEYDATNGGNIIPAHLPGQFETLSNWHFTGGSGIINYDTSGIIQSIAIDPNTSSTIWRGKNSGIERSTDDGSNFTIVGNYVNVRDLFIDPINTINVYIGTEDGLYRTKDAGSSWKRIKTGLEGNSTLNTLGLTPGGLGTRRIFSGSTNGVFMGRTSLDLE